MKLNAKSLDVVGSIGTAGEIWEIELDPRDGLGQKARKPMAFEDGSMVEFHGILPRIHSINMGIFWEYDGRNMMGGSEHLPLLIQVIIC